jgi:putative redox protein
MSTVPVVENAVGETIQLDETKLGRFQTLIRAGSVALISDQAEAVGGLGSGPNPYDLLSAAIGSCTLMTVRLYADRHAWPLERIRVRVTHRRESVQTKDTFTKEVELLGPLSEAQREGLMAISKFCPVSLTLAHGSSIVTTQASAAQSVDTGRSDPPHGEHLRDMTAVIDANFINVDPD